MGKGSSSEPEGSALHTVGSRVWLWRQDGGSGDWLRGEVVAMAGPRLRVRLEDGDERECAASDIPLQNSSAAGVEVGGSVGSGGWRGQTSKCGMATAGSKGKPAFESGTAVAKAPAALGLWALGV